MSPPESRPVSPVPVPASAAARTPSWTEPELLECLARVTQDFSSSLDLDQVLGNVAEGLRCLVAYDTFAVLLLDDLGRQLAFRFAVGFPEDVVRNWRFGLGQGVVGTVADRQAPWRVDDVHREARYIAAVAGVRSELAVPLVAKGRTLGVLDVGHREPGHFSSFHEQLLVLLAGHLANGVENSRLFESVKEQARTLSLLHEISRELHSILDQEKLLERIASRVRRLIDYQLFSLMLWNEKTQLLEHAFAVRQDERFIIKGGFRLGQGVTGTAAALRRPVRVPNVHLNPHYTDCGHGVEVRSELVVPLVFEDRLIGVLDLESVEYNAFTEEHEQILATLGSYIAVALENAHLYAKVVDDERRMGADLEAAREVQKRLLPEGGRRLGLDLAFASEPARELGGDFADVLTFGADQVVLAVGDAAGKGPAAALHAALAVGVLRGHLVEAAGGPGEVLAAMSATLRQPGLENRFVAMALGLFDRRDRSLTLASGGFPRPLLLRSGEVTSVPVQGVPLGLLAESRYDEIRLVLQAGDLVVFCSDGISESVNRCREEFGARHLQALLRELTEQPASDVAAELLRHARRFSGGEDRHTDDRTIAVIKVL